LGRVTAIDDFGCKVSCSSLTIYERKQKSIGNWPKRLKTWPLRKSSSNWRQCERRWPTKRRAGKRPYSPASFQSAARPPFESPKLSATTILTMDDFAVRLDRALARSGPKLIEAQPLPLRRQNDLLSFRIAAPKAHSLPDRSPAYSSKNRKSCVRVYDFQEKKYRNDHNYDQ